MAVADMGLYFDGKCCVCREWINPGDPIHTDNKNAVEGVRHVTAHARCTEDGRAYIARLEETHAP